jgi:hypothetical protein
MPNPRASRFVPSRSHARGAVVRPHVRLGLASRTVPVRIPSSVGIGHDDGFFFLSFVQAESAASFPFYTSCFSGSQGGLLHPDWRHRITGARSCIAAWGRPSGGITFLTFSSPKAATTPFRETRGFRGAGVSAIMHWFVVRCEPATGRRAPRNKYQRCVSPRGSFWRRPSQW